MERAILLRRSFFKEFPKERDIVQFSAIVVLYAMDVLKCWKYTRIVLPTVVADLSIRAYACENFVRSYLRVKM